MDTEIAEFVGYGTPLKDLEKDEIPLKKAIQDETVRDEKGRRRFHGAFTGGFSAGYFNTAGSKEGWLPSTFSSSRSKKADKYKQHPEDFMDAEDLGIFGIAPRKVHTTQKFSEPRESGVKKRAHSPELIPGITAPLRELIKPVSESIGVRLLCNMGWRPGQGIGPRVKRKKKKKKKQEEPSHPPGVKVYGCALPQSSDSEDEDYNHLFAPEDVDAPLYEPKDNLHGIGYKGLSQVPILSSQATLIEGSTTRAILPKDKKKISISGQAFGVGAFEAEDEDIYSKEDMHQYNFFIDDDQFTLPKEKRKDSVSPLTRALEGFHLATKPAIPKPSYPPPTLPPNFKPIHEYSRNIEKITSPSPSSQNELKEVGKHPFLDRHSLSNEARARLLEGQRFTGSVFSLLSPEDSARLQNIRASKSSTNNTLTPLPTQTTPEESKNKDLLKFSPLSSTPLKSDQIENSSSQTSTSIPPSSASTSIPTSSPSTTTFKPFAKDEAKQKRYEVFLTLLSSGNKDALSRIQPPDMTEWEKQRERAEFERSASLFRPLLGGSRGLGNRFVSGGRNDDDDKEIEVPMDQENSNKGDQTAAAKMKMFGQLTREKFPWYPARILCKRFNVPNPYPDATEVGVPKVKKDKYSIFNFLTFDTSEKENQEIISKENESTVQHSPAMLSSEPPPPGTESIDLLKEKTTNQTSTNDESEEEKPRPPMNLFKAVFGNTSSEDEEDDEEIEEQQTLPPLEVSTPSALEAEASLPNPTSKNQVTKPAFGVFANLDLDALNKRGPTKKDLSNSTVETITPISVPDEHEATKNNDEKASSYGPPPPPPGALPWGSSEEAYKKYSRSKMKKHKSKHKHKKHKKHGKSKKKKSSKETYDADTSSSDSEEQETVSESQILEKLIKLHKSMK